MFIPNPDPLQYVGAPNPEIDENWDRLTWGKLGSLINIIAGLSARISNISRK
jgi:hypothetical protein